MTDDKEFAKKCAQSLRTHLSSSASAKIEFEYVSHRCEGQAVTFALNKAAKDTHTEALRRALLPGHFIPFVLRRAKQKRGSLKVADFGANVGVVALPLAAHGLRVLAIEVVPANFIALATAARANELGNFLPVNMAAMDRTGLVSLPGTSDRATAGVEGGDVTVPCDTLVNILETYGFADVDVVKIDIEGAELPALSGADTFFAGRPKTEVIFESNDHACRMFGYDRRDLLRWFVERGFSTYVFRADGLMPIGLDDPQPEPVVDILATKRSPSALEQQGETIVAMTDDYVVQALLRISTLSDPPIRRHFVTEAGRVGDGVRNSPDWPRIAGVLNQAELEREASGPAMGSPSREPAEMPSELQRDTETRAMNSVGTTATSGKISARDVEIAYELMLGRPPENALVVANQLINTSTYKELRERFIASEEYRAITCRELGNIAIMKKPLEWPKMDIEIDVPPDILAAMIRHIEGNWVLLGENEPHWSVLTNEKFKASQLGDNIEEFYASGEEVVSCFTHAADRAGVDYRNLQRCFELGCGVGRLSVWLARIFPELVAADISAPHLRLAAEAVERAGLTNVDLRLVNAIDKIQALPPFDCFVSIIVLQHNPPPVIAFLLRTILAKLNPGGLAYFQVPTYRKDAVFKADQYLKGATVSGEMEVHVIPQADVWRIANETDCQVLDVRENDWTGIPDGVSNSILLMKRPC